MERDVVERPQIGPIAAPVAVADRDDQEDRAYYRNDAFEDEHSRWSALRAHCDCRVMISAYSFSHFALSSSIAAGSTNFSRVFAVLESALRLVGT